MNGELKRIRNEVVLACCKLLLLHLLREAEGNKRKAQSLRTASRPRYVGGSFRTGSRNLNSQPRLQNPREARDVLREPMHTMLSLTVHS
jgi:hypothetical protein